MTIAKGGVSFFKTSISKILSFEFIEETSRVSTPQFLFEAKTESNFI